MLLGFNALLGGLILSGFDGSGMLVAAAVLMFTLTAANLAGGCVCRSHRIAGGVMMLATALPLLLAGALTLFVRALPQELIPELTGGTYTPGSARVLLGVGLLLILVEAPSAAAGIVCLTSGSPKALVLAPPQESGSHVISFAENYASRLREKDGGSDAIRNKGDVS